jgi:hypothetical protein
VACLGGGCPLTDFCNDPNTYTCTADGCSCVTSIDNVSACSDFAIEECIECSSDGACVTALGQPAVCIPTGAHCQGPCSSLELTFCVPVGCPSS